MERFDATKATIDANIKSNGNQEITGDILNSVMKDMVDATDAELTQLSEEIGVLSEQINGLDSVHFETKAGVGLLPNNNMKPFAFKKGEFTVKFVSDAVSTTYVNFYLYDEERQQIGDVFIAYNNARTYSVEEDVAYVGAYMPSAQIVKDGEITLVIEAKGTNGIVGKIVELESEVATKMSGELVGVGKNLYNDKVIKDGYINVTQTQGAKPNYQGNAAGGYGHSLPIPVIGGLTYYIGAESVCAGFYKMFLDNQGNVVELVGAKDGAVNTANNISIVAPTNAAYLVLTTRFGGKDCVNLQVELGETATLYEPYKEGLSLPIELLPTYVQEATFAALEDKPKVARLEALLMGEDGQKVYASAGDSLTEGTGAAVGAIGASDNYYPLFGRAQKTFAYMIAKRNNMAWCNYGISGSTMANITFNGQSHAPFCVDRYANMADNIDVISLWFGVNDSYYGKLAKAEEWLVKTYGKKMYYPLSASQQGTTAADGTPYATNEQYKACITVEEEYNGTIYKGFALYQKQFEGLPTDTDDTTWWGAWNKVLPYLIEKYPFAKILVITGYGTESYLYDSAKAIAEKYGVLHLDLREYGVTWLEGGDSFAIDYDAADFADRTYFKEYASGKVSVNEFRKRTMLYDGLHFNKYGYEYITPFIEKALNL